MLKLAPVQERGTIPRSRTQQDLMQLILLGTGCPQVDCDRYGPANLVRSFGLSFLVDCGSGVTQRLLGAGSNGAAIDAVFLTHLHSDHVVDLFQLVISGWHQGRDRPQRVFGPAGTRRMVDAMLAMWKPEYEQRIAHEKRPSTRALEIEVTEFDEGVLWDRDGVRVSAVAVRHQPVKFAYGFIFEAEGQHLVFSGDTAYCPELIAAGQGADVLVHECFLHHAMKVTPGRTAEGLAAVASYHTLSHEVGKVASAMAARCLVLNHFVPVRFDRAALLAEVRRDYGGPVVIGEDLMSLDLGTGALAHANGMIGIAALAR
jgi:ribonuclease Z